MKTFIIQEKFVGYADIHIEAKNYWEDHYDEVVEEVKEYADWDFKKSRIKDRY